jgi:hypothetical protein
MIDLYNQLPIDLLQSMLMVCSLQQFFRIKFDKLLNYYFDRHTFDEIFVYQNHFNCLYKAK